MALRVASETVWFLVAFWRLRYKLSLRDLAGALANAGGSKCS
jgi:hypothetical protein